MYHELKDGETMLISQTLSSCKMKTANGEIETCAVALIVVDEENNAKVTLSNGIVYGPAKVQLVR